MSLQDAAFYRPDIDWNAFWATIVNAQGSALPAPLILKNGDVLQSEVCADGKVILLRFAVGSCLFEPVAGIPGSASITDLQGNALVTIPYDGTNLPIQRYFNPPLFSANGVRVSAPSGTFRAWIQGFARYGG